MWIAVSGITHKEFFVISQTRLKEIYLLPLPEREKAFRKSASPIKCHSDDCEVHLVMDGYEDQASWAEVAEKLGF